MTLASTIRSCTALITGAASAIGPALTIGLS